uniref:Uncharacterized protein n=2 Tax=viral metagenome TaxID=1070528 RepID=A0A6M3Y4L0_9ZZZZ
MEKRSADTILESLKERIENKEDVDRKVWLDAAFFLSTFLLEEKRILNGMRQEIAQLRSLIYEKQTKKSVAATDIEIEASDLYRIAKDQEAKIDVMEEMIRVAKKSAEENF